MRKRVLLAVIVLVLVSSTSAQQETARMANRRALVDMERSFAKAAATKGTRAAFLEFLADDGIIFQPGPVNGKQVWSARPAGRGLLSWNPIFADVSGAGDLGYTTGPWEFRPNGLEDKPAAFGHYFTIWKKQADGSWKAALDRGVSSEKPTEVSELQFPKDDHKGSDGSKLSEEAGRAALLKLESDFSAASATKGTEQAFGYFLADDARLLRENLAPAVGRQAALAAASAKQGTLTWTAAKSDISRSGDLGYTYGSFEFKGADNRVEHGSYVRVWKLAGGKWKVVMDVLSPDPPA